MASLSRRNGNNVAASALAAAMSAGNGSIVMTAS